MPEGGCTVRCLLLYFLNCWYCLYAFKASYDFLKKKKNKDFSRALVKTGRESSGNTKKYIYIYPLKENQFHFNVLNFFFSS